MNSFLRPLGVYGYDPVEPVILASLVTGDPLLLVGAAGTGKTFLLNSLSEALGLNHRHYNASLISFDDLVGFPYPQPDGSGIRYLETPATLWGAESVLVDELSRCRPEHQNRFFSLIHERRLQGIALNSLRYRWAAMNPPALDDGSGYACCDPLDSALADRFAFILTVADWADLTETDRRAITDPRGDHRISRDGGSLKQLLEDARPKFEAALSEPDPQLLDYARVVTTTLLDARIRLSPRRARQLARNLIGLSTTCLWPMEARLRLGLRWSLPQRATGEPVEETAVDAAHQMAWESLGLDAPERWLTEFHRLPTLAGKVELLLRNCPDPDTGTLAITQFIAHRPPTEQVTFALAVFPALLEHPGFRVSAEGVQELGRIAVPALEGAGVRTWFDARQPRVSVVGNRVLNPGTHPTWTRCQAVLDGLPGTRRRRAEALFARLFQLRLDPPDPADLEASLESAVTAVRTCLPVRPSSTRHRRKTAVTTPA